MANYIDRQAAITAIQERCESSTISTVIYKALEMAISTISELPTPWISVKDKFPEKGQLVIVAIEKDSENFNHNRGAVDTSWFILDSSQPDGIRWVGIFSGERVTHWMPLPDAPEVTE